MSVTSKDNEALPNQFEVLDSRYEWLYLKEAWCQVPESLNPDLGTFRRWCRTGSYGIISGYFGGQIVVRADTIPQVRDVE